MKTARRNVIACVFATPAVAPLDGASDRQRFR